MRYNNLLIPTLKEIPAEAQVISHQLMLRSGMIRRLAAGIYAYLPLGLKTLKKVEAIVREEMDAAGCQELLLPAVQPAELWIESHRWELYGPELLRFKDRKGADFCLGPTHEEVITDIARHVIKSYRDLPVNLYQIQNKFRDEIRPRFGLMRGREFLMKDAYSFHPDEEDAHRGYWKMYEVYRRIFSRTGVAYRPVEADTGVIGGNLSHEFHVLAKSGEDEILACDQCDYAANVEKAERRIVAPKELDEADNQILKRVSTPGKRTVEDVTGFLGIKPSSLVKTLLCQTDKGLVAALVRGDHELNPIKLRAVTGGDTVELADDKLVEKLTDAPVGFAGPIGLKIDLIADKSIQSLSNFVVGANAGDQHCINANWERDVPSVQFADIRMAHAGDGCPRCQGELESYRGIEVGQVFYLGTKYSEPMGATYLDDQGKSHPIVMGCYGIGVSRTMAASIEQNHDKNGIIWPMPIAPYQVLITVLNGRDEKVTTVAEGLYQELLEKKIEVLLDDRDERPGVKFKDADLLGIPIRITVAPKALSRGGVEIKLRHESDASLVPAEEASTRIEAMIAFEMKRYKEE